MVIRGLVFSWKENQGQHGARRDRDQDWNQEVGEDGARKSDEADPGERQEHGFGCHSRFWEGVSGVSADQFSQDSDDRRPDDREPDQLESLANRTGVSDRDRGRRWRWWRIAAGAGNEG